MLDESILYTINMNNILNGNVCSGRFAYSSQTRPCYKFTEPALARSASTIKDRLLNWVKAQTMEYKVLFFFSFFPFNRVYIFRFSRVDSIVLNIVL